MRFQRLARVGPERERCKERKGSPPIHDACAMNLVQHTEHFIQAKGVAACADCRECKAENS